MDESILFSLGFLSQNYLWKFSLNRGYKGIYINRMIRNVKSYILCLFLFMFVFLYCIVFVLDMLTSLCYYVSLIACSDDHLLCYVIIVVISI